MDDTRAMVSAGLRYTLVSDLCEAIGAKLPRPVSQVQASILEMQLFVQPATDPKWRPPLGSPTRWHCTSPLRLSRESFKYGA